MEEERSKGRKNMMDHVEKEGSQDRRAKDTDSEKATEVNRLLKCGTGISE